MLLHSFLCSLLKGMPAVHVQSESKGSGASSSGPGAATHLENCRSLDSILLCLMHILVRAEPISLVPPEKQNTKKMRHKSSL